MQSRIPFSLVADIQEVEPDGSNLFPNVGLAEGQTREEQISDAIRQIIEVPKIDSVVIFGDTRSIEPPLEAMRALAMDKRLKIESDPRLILDENAFPGGGRAAGAMSGGRMDFELEGGNLTRFNHYDLLTVSEYYTQVVKEVAGTMPAHVVNSSMRFSPHYGSIHNMDGQINTHIDNRMGFDARLIHVTKGSGTILFNADDFTVESKSRNGTQVYTPQLIKAGISALVLPEGTSVLITSPSPQMIERGKSPNIHAHGIGREDGQPEERLVERHDIDLQLETLDM